jgi:hypothetical protein
LLVPAAAADEIVNLPITVRNRAAMSRGPIPSTALAWTYPRRPKITSPGAPLLLAQYAARIYAAGNAQGRLLRRAAVLPTRVSGQLLAAAKDRLGQAVTCLVFGVLLSRDQRALIDNGITDDIFGQRRISEHQQRLPVQRGGMMLVDDLSAGAAGRGKGTNRAGFAQSQHRKLRTSRRRCA